MRVTILLVASVTLVALSAPVRTSADPDVPTGDDWVAVSAEFVPGDHRRAPYLGNGAFGTVLPPTGAGYQDYGPDDRTSWPLQEPRYTGTFAAGFYARTGDVLTFDQTIAALPAWTGLTVSTGEHTYAPGVDPATVSEYRQHLDYRTATVTTATTWSPDPGRRIDLSYRTFLSRSRPNLGVQRLTLRTYFTGTIVVTDLLDGAAARRVTPLAASTDPARHRTMVGVRRRGRRYRVRGVHPRNTGRRTGRAHTEHGCHRGSARGRAGDRRWRVHIHQICRAVDHRRHRGSGHGGPSGIGGRSGGRFRRRAQQPHRRLAATVGADHRYPGSPRLPVLATAGTVFGARRRAPRTAVVDSPGRTVVRRLRRHGLLGRRDLDLPGPARALSRVGPHRGRYARRSTAPSLGQRTSIRDARSRLPLEQRPGPAMPDPAQMRTRPDPPAERDRARPVVLLPGHR